MRKPMDKKNCRSVSVRPSLSKVSKRLLYGQLSESTEKFLNTLLCGFQETHSTQDALFCLLQSWQSKFDRPGRFGTIFVDLSKI